VPDGMILPGARGIGWMLSRPVLLVWGRIREVGMPFFRASVRA